MSRLLFLHRVGHDLLDVRISLIRDDALRIIIQLLFTILYVKVYVLYEPFRELQAIGGLGVSFKKFYSELAEVFGIHCVLY